MVWNISPRMNTNTKFNNFNIPATIKNYKCEQEFRAGIQM